jgi:dUTP pyrophosphatase
MRVKFKKLNENAVIPKFAKPGDAAMDIVGTEYSIDEFGNHVYKTGLAWEPEEGYCGLIFPRSSQSKYDLLMANCVGVWDSGHRGELVVKFKPVSGLNKSENIFKVGDRIAQLVILQLPKIEVEEVEILNESERGVGGFGSTGS